MPTYAEFLAGQEGIYAGFGPKMEMALLEGLKPDPVVTNHQSGYAIVLRPAPPLMNVMRRFQNRVGAILGTGSVIYNRDSLHTTISCLQSAHQNHPVSDIGQTVISALSDVVAEAFARPSAIVCRYDGVVFNQHAVIAKGIPNEAFIAAAQRVVPAAAARGITVSYPWGAHMTLARFGQAYSTETAHELARLCEEFSEDLRASGPHAFAEVVSGEFRVVDSTFCLRVDARAPLPSQ